MTQTRQTLVVLSSGVLVIVALLIALYRPFDPGLSFVTSDEAVTVSVVQIGSPAWHAGITAGDRVIDFDGAAATSVPASWESVTVSNSEGMVISIDRAPTATDATLPLAVGGALLSLIAVIGYRRGRHLVVVGTAAMGATLLALPALFGHIPYMSLLLVALVVMWIGRTAAGSAWWISICVFSVFAALFFALFTGLTAEKLAWQEIGITLGAMIVLPFARRAEVEGVAATLRIDNRRAFLSRLGIDDLVGAIVDEYLPFWHSMRNSAREEERARLGTDLHATVLPQLVAALAASSDDADPAVRGHLLEMERQLRTLMSDRRLPVLERAGLIEALEWLAEQTQGRSNVSVDLEIEAGDLSGRPPAAVELAAYRIAQLALSNVVAHAEATTAVISLRLSATEVVMSVTDDGRGIDLAAAPRPEALGLADMRDQTLSVRGDLHIDRHESGGTEVRFTWKA